MSRSRIVQWSALRRWLPGHEGLPDSTFPLSPIGELLTRRWESVDPKEFEQYSAITIRFGGDIELRDREAPFAGAMYAVRPGDLVFSKIDVRNGAIGLLPEALGSAVVTSEYPVYIPDAEQVEAAFLARLLRTAPFQALLHSAASGTSGRKRVHPEEFETLEIPLPDLEQQRYLVRAHISAYAEADRLDSEADRTAVDAVTAFEAALGVVPPPGLPQVRFRIARYTEMDRWSHAGALYAALAREHFLESHFEVVSVDDVAEVAYGLQKSPANRPKENPRPYLRVANVQRGYLDLGEIKLIDVRDEEMPRFQLKYGDLLLCEGNSPELVGRGAIWRNEIPGCVHQNHVLRVRIDDLSEVSPEFLLACINAPFGQAYFRSKAKRTTNLATINSEEVRQFSFPLPPRTEQDSMLQTLVSSQISAAENRASAAARRVAADAAFSEAVFG